LNRDHDVLTINRAALFKNGLPYTIFIALWELNWATRFWH